VLEDLFREHRICSQTTIDRRIAMLKDEQPLTTDPAVIGPAKLLVELLLPQLGVQTENIGRLDQEVALCRAKLADYGLFAALPGPGPASFQMYVGVARAPERITGRLGQSLLPGLSRPRGLLPSRAQGLGFQVDSRPISVLGRPYSIR